MPLADGAELPTLWFGWLTYQDPRGDSLPALGRVWDRFPRFAPEVVDERDPPRRTFDSVEAAMEDLGGQVGEGKRPTTTMYQFGPGSGRKRPIVMSATLAPLTNYSRIEKAQGATKDRTDVYPQMPSKCSGSVKPELINLDGAWTEFYGLFEAVALQLEAFFAWITPIDLANQFRGSGLPYLDLGDVHWINWYGPSLIEHWGGPQVFDRVGFRRDLTDNGGVAVWATEDPPAVDPAMKARGHYPWKRPFYEAVGRETFYLPERRNLPCDEQQALMGVLLPTVADQRRWARQVDGVS